jgi:protein subunit release factor B
VRGHFPDWVWDTFPNNLENGTVTVMGFKVSKGKEEALRMKMRRLNVREGDLEEKFIRSSGRGGQKVNKTSSCVYLKHRPTGIEVKCQEARSQALNRFLARRRLVNKIETRLLGKLSEERRRIEKIRRQKRKRSKRAKEKMLRDKRKRAEKIKQRKVEDDY